MILKYFTLQIYKKFLYKTDLQRKKFKYFVKMRKKPIKNNFYTLPATLSFSAKIKLLPKNAFV